MNSPHPPPAGWYPDPSGRAPFRYWDGAQWTEHTNQGTPPSPSVGQAAPAAPQGYAQGTGYAGYTAATPPAPVAAGPLTAQSFLDDLKRFEGFAIMVVAGALFVLFSFLTWTDAKITNFQNGLSTSNSSNAWAGDGPWLIRGWEANLENLQKFEAGLSVDSGTDMIILLPLLLGAIGVAAAVRIGKPITRGIEIALGISALLSALMIAELVHLNGVVDDLTSIYAQFGIEFEGGPAFGIYLGILASLAMTVGAARMYMASKQPKA